MTWQATHLFRWRRELGGMCRHGHPCRVTARGRMNSIRVEFQDGWRVITGRYAVRVQPLPPPPREGGGDE